MNQTLEYLLCCLVGEHLKYLGSEAKPSKIAHNHVVNRSISRCPFEIVYGRIPHCPLDLAPILNVTKVNVKVEDFIT